MNPERSRLSVLLLRPEWLTDRAIYVAALFGAMLTMVGCLLFAITIARIWSQSNLAVFDFGAFWAAAAATLDGAPALAYDWAAHKAIQVEAAGRGFDGHMPWHYPPVSQMLVAPVGLLPLFPAQIAWTLGTLALFLGVVHAILPGRSAILTSVLTGPAIIVLLNGQIGFLTAAITGLALLWWHRRPSAAGIAIGFLAIKPQLALGFPVALVAAGKWRVFTAAALSVCALLAASLLLLGPETWRAFFASLDETTGVFARHKDKWYLYASLYGHLRFWGLGFGPAMAAQIMLSALVALALWRAMRSDRLHPDAKAALIAYACIAVTPRVLDYDLLTLYIGALFQIRHARRAGLFPGEWLVFLTALVVSLLDLVLSASLNFAIAPALMAALLAGERWREPATAAARMVGDATARPSPARPAIASLGGLATGRD